MKLTDTLRKYLGYSAGTGSKIEIEAMFAEDMYSAHVKMGVVVMAFEALMIVSTLVRGGPGESLRWQTYFVLYLALFLVTGVFLFTLLFFHRKKPGHVMYQVNLSTGYAIFLWAWSCFLTLLDQYNGTNLNVYSYILMALAVFCVVRPWQSFLLFGGGFLVLNGLAIALRDNPVFFRVPLNEYSFAMNSFFVSVLTIIIAITLFRYRVAKKHDSMLIQKQYDQIRDINQRLNDLAMTDQLTGIGNRRFLEEKMQKLQRDEPERCGPVAGMMLDIDFFKQYNDHYGHQAGDACLRRIADIMREFSSEENAFLVRYGGEEFFLCLSGCYDALEKAEELRHRIMACGLARDDQPGGCVTVSVGVDVERECRTIGQDEFLRRCDEALYQAKNTGRNRVAIYEHKQEQAVL